MKIAICTLVGYENYGNRLQNYALQHILEEMGNEVVTIKNLGEGPISLREKLRRAISSHELIKRSMISIKTKLNKSQKLVEQERKQNFLDFTHKYINESSFTIYHSTTDFSFDQEFDAYVIGSDQVWNYSSPRFSMLNFAGYTSKPKMSYAASFGVSSIPPEYRNFYTEQLSQIDDISVRENEGKSIVESLTNKPATVVLDPTMLISSDSWQKVAKGCPVYHEKYLLTYFLSQKSKQTQAYINQYADMHDLKIKNLVDKHDSELYKLGPSDFVNLFSQADAIFTDSFHASVFSILFHKYFEVFSRNNDGPSMNSRINTLLGELGLESCWNRLNGAPVPIDYSQVDQKLTALRAESLDFLQMSLENMMSKVKGTVNG